MALDELRPGLPVREVEQILRKAGLSLLPAAQQYYHVLRGDKALESPNGHPLRVDLSSGLIDAKGVKSIKKAAGGY